MHDYSDPYYMVNRIVALSPILWHVECHQQTVFLSSLESMLRVLLRDSEASKALFEKAGLFKDPGLLEKYVIASEVTVEVLDMLFSRVFGTERALIGQGSGDLKTLLEGLGCLSLSDRKATDGEDLSTPADEPAREVEGLRVKVQDLERQLCAVQRQLQMHEVSQLAVSLDGRLDEVARECERRVSDVRSQVCAEVVRLEKEVSKRVSTGDVKKLSEDVSRLKDGERSLGERISSVEETLETKRALMDEIQGELKRFDRVLIQIDPLNGIIAKLTRDCGGNVHEKGVVEVTASGCCGGTDNEPKNAVDLGTNTWFGSEGKANSWICYNFKKWRVAPASYSIRSARGSFPRSWVFEVSNDGEKWEVVDRRDNNSDLNAACVTRNFEISPRPSGSFRFVRLLQTGKNSAGDDEIWLSSFEVFGTLSSQ